MSLIFSRLHQTVVNYNDEPEVDEDYIARTPPPKKKDPDDYDYLKDKESKGPVYEDEPYACDKQSTLYIFNQTKFMKGSGSHTEGPTKCSKPYFVKRIPYSNLLLVTVKAMYPSCSRKLSTDPEIITYVEDFPCHKLYLNELESRKNEECYTDHPEVSVLMIIKMS